MSDVKGWTLMFYFASDNPLAPGIVQQLKAVKQIGFHPQANFVVHLIQAQPARPFTSSMSTWSTEFELTVNKESAYLVTPSNAAPMSTVNLKDGAACVAFETRPRRLSKGQRQWLGAIFEMRMPKLKLEMFNLEMFWNAPSLCSEALFNCETHGSFRATFLSQGL